MTIKRLNNNQLSAQLYNKIINIAECSPDFTSNWSIIDMEYKKLGWQDKITDDQKIEEYHNVNELYLKYIQTKKKTIISLLTNNPNMLLEQINTWLSIKPQLPKKGWSRVFITYISLRKSWLLNLRNLIYKYVQSLNNNKEE